MTVVVLPSGQVLSAPDAPPDVDPDDWFHESGCGYSSPRWRCWWEAERDRIFHARPPFSLGSAAQPDFVLRGRFEAALMASLGRRTLPWSA